MKHGEPRYRCVWLLVVGLCLALWGCARPMVRPAEIQLPPQDAAVYLGAPWRVSPAVQEGLTARFWREYFACWREPRPAEGLEAMCQEFAFKTAEPGLGENLLPRPAAWVAALAQNANLASYPNAAWRGLTLDWLDLRLLPTARPSLGSAELPGDLSFDRLQQSLLPPNLPVFVHHQSLDGAWLLVQTPIAWGWLPAGRVAAVGPDQARRWQAARQMVFVRDDVAVHGPGGRYLFKAGLGCLFPAGDGGRILAATADQNGLAVIQEASFAPDAAVAHPLPLSASNLSMVIDRLLGQPYGWGGLYGNRDCSATLQDAFRVFGLWLPRNSADQAQSGQMIDLAGLEPDQKQERIGQSGLPGLSLLWMPGHIMLYLGQYQGEAMAFHNAWGLRTKGGRQDMEGRAILGRALITTLTPGREMPDLARPGGLLINRVETLTLLVDGRDLRP